MCKRKEKVKELATIESVYEKSHNLTTHHHHHHHLAKCCKPTMLLERSPNVIETTGVF